MEPTDQVHKNNLICDLMTQYESNVWSFAFSLVRRQDLADDITQDVFVKAYEKIDSFRGEASVKTWLLAITRNVATDYRRSSFLKKVTLLDYLFQKGSHPSAEKEGIGNIAANDVWEMVLRLPANQREVLVLHAHHGLSATEIASVLQISEAAVKSRLHRARNKISRLIMEEGEPLHGKVRV